MCFMAHHEHFAILIIIRICGIVHELSAVRSQLLFLLLALLFVVAEFFVIVLAFDQAILVTWSGMMAPPSTELP